jgi:transcription initiation factor IIF auxiliary subunit
MSYLTKEQLNIKIIDTIFDPNIYGVDEEPVFPRTSTPPSEDMKYDVRFNKSDETHLYKVWLFLSGNDLPFVDVVTYQLHESFKEPLRNVSRSPSNPDCRLVIWTWGIFQVNATIYDKSGRLYTLTHQLNYGKLLKDFEGKINFISENPETSLGATLVA